MTSRVAIAARIIWPFFAVELLILVLIWFVVPESSWLTYALGAVSLFALPLLAAARLAGASFGTSAAVLSALIFPVLGVVWAACAAVLGYAGAEWGPYLLGVAVSTAMFVPVQFAAAYIGARYVRSIFTAAS